MILVFSGRPKQTAIGLDLGESGARAVQLTRCDDRYTVSGAALYEWSHQLKAGAAPGAPGELPSVADRIQGVIRQEAFRGRSVVAGLNPPAVEFHTLELPAAVLADRDSDEPGARQSRIATARADVDQVVHWEMLRLMNLPSDPPPQIETRHWPLLPARRSSGPVSTAIGVAARWDAVLKMHKDCQHAGLRCLCVDVGAAALCRFGGLLNTWNPQEVWGVLDIGHDEARLVLCVGDVPVLVRRGGSGGRTWTERIAEALQLSLKAADVHKRDHGIALTVRGVRSARGQERPPDSEVASILLGALRTELRDLAAEVKRSYEYVLSCYPGRHAVDLVLVGGGAAMRNLPEFLGSALGIPVRRASHYLAGQSCRLRDASRLGELPHRLEVYASAIGLAVGN